MCGKFEMAAKIKRRGTKWKGAAKVATPPHPLKTLLLNPKNQRKNPPISPKKPDKNQPVQP